MDYTIVGVAKASIFDGNRLVGNGILDTLSNSSIEITTSSTEIRGGDRNKLLGVYYHTPTGNVTIENAKMNLDLMNSNFGGAGVTWGTEIFQTEIVELVGKKGTLSKTPVKVNDSDEEVYCYVGKFGSMERVVVNPETKEFTVSTLKDDSKVEVLYRYYNANVKTIRIPASIIPSRVRVVLTVSLSSNETSKGIVGYCQIDLGTVQLSGEQTFDMTPDGYTTQSLNGMLLETNNDGFVGFASEASTGEYGKVSLIINDSHWYDDIIALAIEGGDFTLKESATKKLNLYAISSGQGSFLVDNKEITFESKTTGTATIDNDGIVTGVSAGDSTIVAKIKENTDIEARCEVTVEAPAVASYSRSKS